MTSCNVCGSESSHLFTTRLRQNHRVKFYCCTACGFVQTEKPYWLSEVYSDPLSPLDTGVLARNIALSKSLFILLRILAPSHGHYLDYAGGYGILTRLMRDLGLQFEWFDPYSDNLFARGFESTSKTISPPVSYNAVTAIECLEHLEDPLSLILDILKISPILIFSTELVSSPPPGPSWWYYMTERGGHISFFSRTTLKFIASQYRLYYRHIDSFHILSRSPIHPLKILLVRILLKLKFQVLSPLLSCSLTFTDHQRLLSQNRG